MDTDTDSSSIRLRLLRGASRVSHFLAISAAVLAGLGILVLVGMTLISILMRNAGGGGVPNAVGWGEMGVAAIAYLGLAYAQHRDAHVSTTVVVRLLPGTLQKYAKAFWMIAVCLLMAWVGVETTQQAVESTSSRETRFGTVPIWPATIAVTAGIWLLLLELVVQLLNLLFGPATDRQGGSREPGDSVLTEGV